MLSRRTLLKTATALVAASLIMPSTAQADEPIPVVATFSILGDMVERIGGEHVALTTIVGPGGDSHVYQPTPQDAVAVASAEVMFVNGLQFEGWLDRLAEAAPFQGEMVVATMGIDALAFEDGHEDHHDEHGDDHHDEEHADHDDHDHDKEHANHDDHDHDKEHADHGDDHADHDDHDHDKDHAEHDGHDHDEEHAEHDDHAGHDHGAFDPHAWQTVENALIYVDNITQGLVKAAPEHADVFEANRDAYVAELKALEAELDAIMAAIPEDKRTVVTSHDAFGYFGAHYGMTFKAPQGLSTASEASAADVAKLIEQIREEGISAAFVEQLADDRLLKQITNETGISIGGKLYAGTLSGEDGPAATYIDMLRHNAMAIANALGS